MDMKTILVIFSFIFGYGVANNCSNVIVPTRARFQEPFPGDFLGNSTRPEGSSCISLTNEIICTDVHDTVFTDGIVGDETGTLSPAAFHAWNTDSRISFEHTTAAVMQLNLFFYHNPSMGIGLPNFTFITTGSPALTGTPLQYTLLGNQDLSSGDATVRNVTIALTTTKSNTFFNIEFAMTSEIHQFAVSEVQLCSDAATIEAETLSVSLNSEPFSGPDILLPADPANVPSDALLTCTVANQGRFQWQWTALGTNTPPIWISDETRSTALNISLGTSAVGNYSCTASYHPDSKLPPSPITDTFTVGLERILSTEQKNVSIDTQTSIVIPCRVAGYAHLLSTDPNLIEWRFNGQKIFTSDKYFISIGTSSCPPYGVCRTSLLTIKMINSNDVGNYTCAFEDLKLTIGLLEGPTPSPPSPDNTTPTTQPTNTPSEPTTSGSTVPPTTQAQSSIDLIPIIGGAVGVVCVAFFVLGVVIIVIFCRVGGRSGSTKFRDNIPTYDEEPDALYTELNKPLPPPLPVRTYTLTGNYATIDSGNGTLEMSKMVPVRDSIASMPTDVDGNPGSVVPQHQTPPPVFPELMPAKLTAKPNFLLSNPLYLSADNLAHPDPPSLPQRRTGSNPCLNGSPTHEGLNIYAVPYKIAPPIPERMSSPPNNTPLPMYSEPTLTPAIFTDAPRLNSPTSGDFAAYSSIYADPKPLLREEGPVEIRHYHVKELRQLGTGQFGEVMLAETRGLSLKDMRLSDTNTDKSIAIRVAIKRLKHDADSVVKEAFEKEIKFMARLNHMNVIRLLAICTSDHPFIVMEYMEGGDLNQHLNKYTIAPRDSTPSENQIPVASLLYTCVQIANGMRYLASLHFIHRDLATRNCLVGQNNTVKIADFGMSRSLYSSQYYRIRGRAMLPIRWMANECFYGRFSEKTDVWAFGVLMWEVFMLVKEQPYSSMSDQEVIENAVNTEKPKMLEKPEHCPEEVYDTMLQCWITDEEKRINFEDLYSSLAALHSYSDL